jgi:hypothetical protein
VLGTCADSAAYRARKKAAANRRRVQSRNALDPENLRAVTVCLRYGSA